MVYVDADTCRLLSYGGVDPDERHIVVRYLVFRRPGTRGFGETAGLVDRRIQMAAQAEITRRTAADDCFGKRPATDSSHEQLVSRGGHVFLSYEHTHGCFDRLRMLAVP